MGNDFKIDQFWNRSPSIPDTLQFYKHEKTDYTHLGVKNWMKRKKNA